MRTPRQLLPIAGFLCLLCLLLLPALPASAEKTDWVDKNYDFSKVHKALVYDIVLTDTSEFESDLLEQTLQEDYLKNAQRPKYQLIRPEKAAVLSPENPQAAADIYIKAELLKWHDDSYIKEPYTSWETKTGSRTKKMPDGSKIEETYQYTVPVYHPARTIYTSTVRLKFEVFDAKTNQRIMARDELRLRDDSQHGQKGIFGRISKSFFDDLGKKLHH
ncbi:hypothetical protein SAMN05216582_10348 [Selenomonas ruminantium]|uniref:Uncharacterized protein n=1 Tax=Selenomonas ruminantium TaxID=971 RepID=A0A1M6S112_SELRU|nr:hypothetical protein [Selenomonas ruminantium]SHK38247.1 hypothetical protein SAMN05216582_10348 [Selenomonas ruminantium]